MLFFVHLRSCYINLAGRFDANQAATVRKGTNRETGRFIPRTIIRLADNTWPGLLREDELVVLRDAQVVEAAGVLDEQLATRTE